MKQCERVWRDTARKGGKTQRDRNRTFNLCESKSSGPRWALSALPRSNAYCRHLWLHPSSHVGRKRPPWSPGWKRKSLPEF